MYLHSFDYIGSVAYLMKLHAILQLLFLTYYYYFMSPENLIL